MIRHQTYIAAKSNTKQKQMNVYTLPDDIFSDKQHLTSDVIIYHYTSTKDRFKEKSILKRNAFSLVICGRKTMHFAEKTISVNDAEIHILAAGNCIASVSISEVKNFESVLIFFDTSVLNEFYATQTKFIDKQKVKKIDSNVHFKKDDFVNNYIQSLLLMLKSNKLPSEAMKRLKIQELFLYLLENHTDQFLSFQPSHKMTEIEMQIRKVVEANKENSLTLDELSFLCNISTSTFKRHFKKIFNTSHKAWLSEQKMNLALKMLKEQNQKPSEVWHKLGFETHTGFTKSFKKHFGSLPKEFATN
jgi:AraC family transcriptional regulator, exoenzyme S synthesis regulatory protein ExsA